jgi:hypothetical protein
MKIRRKKKTKHNYQERLEEDMASNPLIGAPGTVTMVNIEHDSWCNHFNGGRCNCNPEMGYQPMFGDEEDMQ